MSTEIPQPGSGNELPPGIGSPARRALSAQGITHLSQLTAWREADLLELHGIGPKALGILREALTDRGLSFATDSG